MTKKLLTHQEKNKSKIRIRPNWIVDNYRKNFVDRDSFKILSVGRLEDQKNFVSLIRLFDKNSNIC